MQIVRRDEPVEQLGGGWDLSPVLRRVYRQRGISEPQELDRSLQALLPYKQLGGIQEAAALLRQNLCAGQSILVVGDFDADGATSSALMCLGLRSLGCRRVEYLVPNRFEFGYGLTPEIVELALQRGPHLIVTVDNGISSHAGVERARAAGVDVLITDHHLPGEHLPAANAIVNPNVPGDLFPSKAMAGVGVAFYLLLALRAQLREQGWFADAGRVEPNMAELLDLVALGTVADVVPLDRNNRALVYQGLRRIRAGRCRAGILALLEVAGRDYRQVQASDIGFAVGPRLNAAGRLDDMSLGIECLLSDDPDRARELARQLDQLNRQRRQLEQEMQEQAQQQLENWQFNEAQLPWGMCLYRPEWHQGVIGIIAARIKERYHRPVIVFADADTEGLLIKGSARSVPGLHIRDALDLVAVRHPHLLSKFGGHAMAAGMSLRRSDFVEFASAFDQAVHERMSATDLQPLILSDGAVPVNQLNLQTALELSEGGPWGQGFSEPVFDDRFEVLSSRVVGEKHWKLLLRHTAGSQPVDAIAFNSVALLPEMPKRVHAAYRLDVNNWRGQSSLQLQLDHIEPCE